MARKYRGFKPTGQKAATSVEPQDLEYVAQLIAANRSILAVDYARELHRRFNSTESLELVFRTYWARWESLLENDLETEAEGLLERIDKRHPRAPFLPEWREELKTRKGGLAARLAPLNDTALPEEKRLAIANFVRRQLTDPRELANCEALPANHPWRVAAAAVWLAFEAVTTGPADDSAIALPDVARSSPLAPWKMLIRAIAAFYRREDGLCERSLASIEANSAPAKLAAALRAMLLCPAAPGAQVSPANGALMQATGGGLTELQTVLRGLDHAFGEQGSRVPPNLIRDAVAVCERVAPDLIVRLKQHTSIRAMLNQVPLQSVLEAMGGSSRKDAHFWRLLARAMEKMAAAAGPAVLFEACGAWEEFRKHAIAEKWLPAQGPELAALYLHMAHLLRGLPPVQMSRLPLRFGDMSSYYEDQPPEILALRSKGPPDLYFVDRAKVFERACAAEPAPENFARWVRCIDEQNGNSDLAAERWVAARPNDRAPLLCLMVSAEKRNALQKAVKYLDRAEALDPMHPDVRRARMRLLVSMTLKHLEQKKGSLAAKDSKQLDELPQTKQGDRPAFVAALRFVACTILQDKAGAEAAYRIAANHFADDSMAELLFLEVERRAGCRSSVLGKPQPPTKPLAASFGRVCAICDEMGVEAKVTSAMVPILQRDLSQLDKRPADSRALVALGEAALRAGFDELVFLISGEGLKRCPDRRAAFLFLRAQILLENERISDCLAAASELARRSHDENLLQRISEFRTEELAMMGPATMGPGTVGTVNVPAIVKRESEDTVFPDHDDFIDDEDDLDDGDFDGYDPFGLPRELKDMVERMGPQEAARQLARMLGFANKGGRGKKPPKNGQRFPFPF